MTRLLDLPLRLIARHIIRALEADEARLLALWESWDTATVQKQTGARDA